MQSRATTLNYRGISLQSSATTDKRHLGLDVHLEALEKRVMLLAHIQMVMVIDSAYDKFDQNQMRVDPMCSGKISDYSMMTRFAWGLI